ncbi:hypothetical protein [Silvibacterium acidisoli]|uniref:hypothetical protein n=1 Tax=Acidobacteriaceae bacterium ZG23-2 TaxID=2883246 RepID=UPI00406C606F
MHTEDSPIERTPDLVAKIRALRQQTEKAKDRFTDAADYDVRRVTGRRPETDADVPPPDTGKKKRGKKTEQASIDFPHSVSQDSTNDGDEA